MLSGVIQSTIGNLQLAAEKDDGKLVDEDRIKTVQNNFSTP